MQNRLLIEVRNLSVQLGRASILEEISLDIYAGTIHALLGPNGAGKTTLIRSLLGNMPHRGVVRFHLQGSAAIGYVPQVLEIDHSIPMTVQDFLAITLQRRAIHLGKAKRQRAQIRHLLDGVDCAHLQDRRMSALSGGELQRVMLAQALSPNPQVLLLDEPASNLDEPGRRSFERMLRNLRDEQGVTIVLVGHHLAAILQLADQVSVLNRNLILSGPADAVARSSAMEQVFGLAADGPLFQPGGGHIARPGA